jgi:hypothetical protein
MIILDAQNLVSSMANSNLFPQKDGCTPGHCVENSDNIEKGLVQNCDTFYESEVVLF